MIGLLRDYSNNGQQGASMSTPDQLSGKKIWLPPRDSNPDMLIQSQLSCR